MAQVTITKANFLIKVNNYLNDNRTGTTTSAGNADRKDLIDSELAHYKDDYFNGWWVYVASQLRRVSNFTSSTGTVEWVTAVTAQVGSSVAYELHGLDRNKKAVAANQALTLAYPWFYNRVEDETTLKGTGSGDTEYQVPATFTEFPEQIFYKVITNTTDIEYREVLDFKTRKAAGVMYFYADITIDEEILLVGKTYLTQFTSSDTSATELDDSQANVVAMLAAAIFSRMMSSTVNTKDAGRYDSLAQRYEKMYEEQRNKLAEPRLVQPELDYSWLRDVEVTTFV
jgi:hypothetical protein